MNALPSLTLAAGLLVAAPLLTTPTAATAAGPRAAAPTAAPTAAAPTEAAPQRGRRAEPEGRGGSRAGGGRTSAGRGSGRDDGRPVTPSTGGLDLARRYFHMCDQDGDGFMSYYESRTSLGLARDEFAVYDVNVDGLCDEDEFRARYEAIVSKGGAFKPPRVAGENEDARQRARAAELLGEFDRDADTLMDVDEIEDVLEAHAIEGVEIELLMSEHDVDGSGRIDAGELVRLLPLLSREMDPTAFMKVPARTIVELFGMPEEREGGPDWAPEPPRIEGPIPVFYRLDLDRDQIVSEHDLKELLKPLKLPVRLNTVVFTLDEDGDGGLSREELRRSMTRP